MSDFFLIAFTCQPGPHSPRRTPCLQMEMKNGIRPAHLLCMLRDHDYERKVVHAQSRVEKLIGINEEDNILDGFFNDTGVGF